MAAPDVNILTRWLIVAGIRNDHELGTLFLKALSAADNPNEILETGIDERMSPEKMAQAIYKATGTAPREIFMLLSGRAAAKKAQPITIEDAPQESAPLSKLPRLEKKAEEGVGEGPKNVPLSKPNNFFTRKPQPVADLSDDSEEKEPNGGGRFAKLNPKNWSLFKKKEGDETPKPQNDSKPKGKPWKINWGLLFLVVAIVLVGFALFGLTSSLGGSGVSPELDPNSPAVQQAEVPQDPQSQLESLDSGDIFESTEPMLKKPTLATFDINNIPWNWIVWILFLVPLLFVLRQDRFAAHEETDLRTVVIGLAVIFLVAIFTASNVLPRIVTFQGADPTFALQAQNLISGIIFAAGVVFNLGMQLSATLSGKRDYSALAVAGLFLSGVVVIWVHPDSTAAQTIGWLLMFGGLALEYYEITRESHQTGAAITVSLLMIGGFLLGFWMGIGQFTEWIVGLHGRNPSVLWVFLYDGRFFISAVFGIFVAMGFGVVLGLIMLKTESASSGSSEDSTASIAKLGKVVLYDAIAFGVMLMYPLAAIAWYLSALASVL